MNRQKGIGNFFFLKVGRTFLYYQAKFERDLSTSVFTTAVSISRPQKCSANFTMEKIVDQRVCLKFCLANEFSCADSLKMLKKAFGDNCMSKTQAYDWYKSFKDGREVVEDLPRSGRPSTSTTDDNIIQIKKLVLENRHSSVIELARELSIDKMTVHNILTNVLCMKRVAAKLVPKELVSEDMVSRAASDPNFMKRIITGDETWVYEYDTLTAQQSTEWRLPNEPNPKNSQIRNEN
ncbi:protein GVQW3-like isoform X2 [Coccinella septempunctata]|uniref:protein GVQW3-like n=1 Tax=Coccinella septempunctata TaxID=41139 RepID=UPI001D08A638|nr:protein GVQW3-like [Coccinella septempunctata]XP_044752697.1 protein GVQW3-like isoform X2 [Coccinella septempunctata]